MKEKMYKKGLVVGIIVLFITMTLVPSINGNIERTSEDYPFSETIIESLQTTDSWSVYQHDTQHTGYSPSDAPDTNNLIWSMKTYPAQLNSPVVAYDKVYAGRQDSFYCYNAYNGSLIWIRGLGDWCSKTPGVADGKVYVGANDYKVYCLDAYNGSTLWTYYTGSISISPAVIVDKRVYMGCRWHSVSCLNADNGSLIWTYPMGHNAYGSPAVDNGKVYAGSYDKKVHCIDADNGSQIWTYETNGFISTSPTVKDGKVYVGSKDSILYCLNAENGSVIWTYDSNDEIRTSPAIAYGKIYIGILYDVYCFDAANGSIVWNYTTDAFAGWSAPAVADGKVYVGSNDRNVYCLDAFTGEKIWNYTALDDVKTSPAIAYGNVYIGSDDGWLFCFGDLNNPPSAPNITGPNSGKPGTPYTFSFTSMDPDGDQVSYYIDWDDGNITSWTGFQSSGTSYTENYSWVMKGIYLVRSKARDKVGNESDWRTLIVSIPRDKAINNVLFWRLLERFPLLERFLNAI